MKKYFAIAIFVCLMLCSISGCAIEKGELSLKNTLSSTRNASDKDICFCGMRATKEIDVFGQTEHYCSTHYFEVIKLLDMLDPYISK